MFTGGMTPEDVMASIDQRRTETGDDGQAIRPGRTDLRPEVEARSTDSGRATSAPRRDCRRTADRRPSAAMRSRVLPDLVRRGALLLYGVFIVVPSLLGIAYAFTDWNSYSTDLHWVGLDNFATILSSRADVPAVHPEHGRVHDRDHHPQDGDRPGPCPPPDPGVRRLSYLYRAVIFLPAVLPILVVSLIFRSVLNPATGLLNERCGRSAWARLAQHWLTDVPLALWSVIARRHLARRRLHHGDPHRGPEGDPARVLRGRRDRRRQRSPGVPARHAAAARAGAAGHDGAQPALRAQGLRHRVRAHERRPGRATDTVYTAVFEDFSKGRYGIATALLDAAVPGHDRARLPHDPCPAARRGLEVHATRQRARGGLGNLLASGAAVVVLAPIYLVFVNALKTRAEASSMGIELPAIAAVAELLDRHRRRASWTGLLQQRPLLLRRDGPVRHGSALAAYVLARNPLAAAIG